MDNQQVKTYTKYLEMYFKNEVEPDKLLVEDEDNEYCFDPFSVRTCSNSFNVPDSEILNCLKSYYSNELYGDLPICIYIPLSSMQTLDGLSDEEVHSKVVDYLNNVYVGDEVKAQPIYFKVSHDEDESDAPYNVTDILWEYLD